MPQLEVDKIIPQSGTTLTIGDSGDTISFASGVLPALESLTITGDLTVDTTTLKVDSTNNRVGIGTASPSYDLQISKDGGGASVRLDVVNTGVAANDDTLLSFVSGSNNNENIIYFGDTDDNNVGIIRYNHASDYMSFTTNASERMRIDSSGNVGIGTTSPAAPANGLGVHIQRSSTGSGVDSNSLLFLENNSNLVLQSTAGTTNKVIFMMGDVDNKDIGRIQYDNNNNSMTFKTNAADRVVIDSSGNVGIGTTSPNGELEVAGEIIADNNGSNDGGAVMRAWGPTSQYAMFGTANMALLSEYAVITNGTNTYIGGGTGGSVYIRNGANDSNPQIQVGPSQINMTGLVDFSSNLVLPSNAQLTTVSGNYGNFQVDGGGTVGAYDGLNVNGHTVFMSNGSRAGIYNDTNNEWLLYGDFNGDTALHYNGAIKLQTTSTGVSVTGTLSATTLSGAGVYTAGTVSATNNSNGYIRFANNLIIQWMRKSVGGTVTITYPIAMDHRYGCYTGSETSGNATLRIHSYNNSSVTVGNRDGNITGWVLVFGRKT